MKHVLFLVAASLIGAALLGCSRADTSGPPELHLGSSVCVECDMIINDERFATAMVVRDDRGRRETLLFDDIGDHTKYEFGHRDLVVEARWVHDHGTSSWIPAADAFYAKSQRLHTPMGTGIAAFANEADAQALVADLGGKVVRFAEVWPQ